MAWHRIGHKLLSETNADLIDWCIYAALGGDELNCLLCFISYGFLLFHALLNEYHRMLWRELGKNAMGNLYKSILLCHLVFCQVFILIWPVTHLKFWQLQLQPVNFEAETKYMLFCRCHFQMHYPEWKVLFFFFFFSFMFHWNLFSMVQLMIS